MKDFIRQRLLEAIKSTHWIKDSYPTRILNSTFSELGDEAKSEVDKRIKFIESLEFSEQKPQKIGIWVYKAPVEIKHPPFEKRDKGYLLLAIVNNNNMTTLYWKHKKEGEYDFSIDYDDLVRFSESEYYDSQNNPITIANIKKWYQSQVSPSDNIKRETFKKINLANNAKVKYYEDSNKFETIEGNQIDIKDIFNLIPDENMKLNVFAKSPEDTKLELIDLVPADLSDKYSELLESLRKK